MVEHAFTPTIRQILREEFGAVGADIFDKSLLLQYLNFKTRSANRSSKARGAFASIYVLYVLVEDYVSRGYVNSATYADYAGAQFGNLLTRAKQLPFGGKLQNHAFNTRLNGEFARLFPTAGLEPVIRNLDTKRYWINERLLLVGTSDGAQINVAAAILRVVEAYIQVKQTSFLSFIEDCRNMESIQNEQPATARQYIESLIRPTVDARLFEIVSYAILKAYYSEQSIFWGWERDNIVQEFLTLYKTGRTNANDGGIDFVMKPLGRFFQVTETVDVTKYFLDIEKIQHFPLTFVVKSIETAEEIKNKIRAQAARKYPVNSIIEQYMACVEEIINIPELLTRFQAVADAGSASAVLSEIVLQSQVEFNLNEAEDEAESDIADAPFSAAAALTVDDAVADE